MRSKQANHATGAALFNRHPPRFSTGLYTWINKYDKRNIYAIWKRFGNKRRIKTFPGFGIAEYMYYTRVKGVRWVSFLDYFNYNKSRALEVLNAELGYRPYPYKHYESVFTRFYQGYLLPNKFGVDKRRNHLSNLIVSGQMTRDYALSLLEQNPYPSPDDLKQDVDYFLKKMGWTSDQLESYIARPEKPHDLYGSEQGIWTKYSKVSRFVRGWRRLVPRLGV